jgi:Spy/CpxP family protein refolding chaperone
VAALVLDHGADFALADSQRVMLQSIRHTQDSANGPWLKKLEALRPTSRPANGAADLSQEQRDEIATRRAAIAEAMEGMREANAEARQRTMALLTPEQQKKAAVLEEEARKKAREDSGSEPRNGSSEGRGRRGGGGGGRGGMGRPPED